MDRLILIALSLVVASRCMFAQATPAAPEATPPVGNPQLETVSKKVDEVNTKLDALSQQILKIEQQLASQRPGVMIGEKEPATTAAPVAPVAVPSGSAAPGSANAHTVAKGETLTAIAKQYKVTVEELQKFNHIEDGRKLQAGQTVQIPAPGAAATSPAATASPQ